jgi:hypothetical protein
MQLENSISLQEVKCLLDLLRTYSKEAELTYSKILEESGLLGFNAV